MAEKTFDTYQSSVAQVEYCSKNKVPHFAPKSGVCWSCNQNIYEELPHRIHTTVMCGIPVEEAATQLVTGCPHCGRSYCD